MKVNILSAFILLASCAGAQAQTIDDARRLAEDGDMNAAIEMLRNITEASPKESEAPKLLGDYYLAVGDEAAATEAYGTARTRGNRDAILGLASMAADRYAIDEARTLIEDYKKTLMKRKRVIAEDESEPVSEKIDRVDNALHRVEQIEVIDSITVDAEDFFTHYRLSPESGSLNSTRVLPESFPAADPTVVYEPQSQREMIWAAPASDDGSFQLFSSSALYGDTWEQPTPLGADLSLGADANYPFLMPDGITLYYASDGGEDGLGGLDIYISRRGDSGFLQPQNLGMPYNSPYDDYMLAIDELTGVGWWATDRNRIPGKVTIYVFVPQELRRNVDPDAPDLAARARLTSIADTWNPGTDRKALIEKIKAIEPDARASRKQFEIYIPGRGVLTTYKDFHNPEAVEAMHACQVGLAKLTEAQRRLAGLRERYAKGDTDTAGSITQLEQEVATLRDNLLELRNAVVKAESDQ